jgi:hypothetical protein
MSELTPEEQNTLDSYCDRMTGGKFEAIWWKGLYIILDRQKSWNGKPDKLVTVYCGGSMGALISKLNFHIDNQDNEK